MLGPHVHRMQCEWGFTDLLNLLLASDGDTFPSLTTWYLSEFHVETEILGYLSLSISGSLSVSVFISIYLGRYVLLEVISSCDYGG